jgi:uncharacterized surface protein with fasciclin (FAS1) repeats
MRRTIALGAAALTLALTLAACGGDDEDTAAEPAQPAATAPADGEASEAASADIVTTAVEAGNFTTLAQALEAAGLVETLQGEGPFTVFAPTDEAFAKLPEGTLEDLLKPENKDQLTDILTYHVVEGEVTSDQLEDGQMAMTLQGGELPVSIMGGTVMVGDATVTTPDVRASNGVIHVIDTVLLPPADASAEGAGGSAEADIVETAVEAGNFSTLATALESAGLVDTLQTGGPFTVFAPTDEAFAKLPEGTLEDLLKPENKDQLTEILTYHVAEGEVPASALEDGQAIPTLQGGELSVSLGGSGVSIGDASVTTPDVGASNGIIHVIDTVLIPMG